MAGTVAICADASGRYTAFTESVAGLQVPEGTAYNFIKGVVVSEGRNLAVRRLHGDWLWFMDDDHTFAPDTLLRLLAHDVDIVVPLVLKKRPPFTHVLYDLNEDGFGPATLPAEERLLEVYAAGTAGMLVKRTVFEALADPWFEFTHTPDGEFVGEDLLFCAKAQEAGFKVFCDLSVQMGHITPMAVMPKLGTTGWTFDVVNA